MMVERKEEIKVFNEGRGGGTKCACLKVTKKSIMG